MGEESSPEKTALWLPWGLGPNQTPTESSAGALVPGLAGADLAGAGELPSLISIGRKFPF